MAKKSVPMEGLPILEAIVLLPHAVFALYVLAKLFSNGILRPFWKRDFPLYEVLLHVQEDWRNTCAFSRAMGDVYVSSSWLGFNALYLLFVAFVIPQAYVLNLFTASVCIPLILVWLYQDYYYTFIALGLSSFMVAFTIATIIAVYAIVTIVLSICFVNVMALKFLLQVSV